MLEYGDKVKLVFHFHFGHANANFNHYHYSFLYKLIPYTVYKHRKICICMTKCRAGFATVYDIKFCLAFS